MTPLLLLEETGGRDEEDEEQQRKTKVHQSFQWKLVAAIFAARVNAGRQPSPYFLCSRQ
jgi:hypothetical protein